MPVRRHLSGLGLSHVQTMKDGVYHTYHQDEQGSTAYVTGSYGAVENCYFYDAFGNVIESQENIRNRILYTGQQYDQETGQYYLRARFYNPVIGRFTQEDTYRGDGLNLYAYCENNPVMYYDPSGYAKNCKRPDQAESEEQKVADQAKSDKQKLADQAAQDYNAKYNPVERAESKGYTGVKETPNGGASFQGTEYMYNIDGQETVVKIEATGSRSGDFNAANLEAGLKETPDEYVWHHLDDYNVADNTFTLELVQKDAHNATKPHSGGCAQYDAVHGASYNPAKK